MTYKTKRFLLFLLSPWIFLRFYVRDAVALVHMCREAMSSSQPRQVQDTILIVLFMVAALAASPVVLLSTSFKKLKRTLSIHAVSD